MKIRYRSRTGKILTPSQAKKQKSVTSELTDDRGKRVGKPISGYQSSTKKLARAALPEIKPIQHRRVSKPVDEDEYEPDYEEFEDAWDEISDDFPEIDMYMDLVDDLIEDEGEWYEEA